MSIWGLGESVILQEEMRFRCIFKPTQNKKNKTLQRGNSQCLFIRVDVSYKSRGRFVNHRESKNIENIEYLAGD